MCVLGGCDLVLVDSPRYANGAGLTIHIRTKIETWWSYIESAVVRIGDQTLELKGSESGDGPHYWINGIAGNKDVEKDDNIRHFETAMEEQGCFKIHYTNFGPKKHKFRIDLNCLGDAISMETFNTWIAVNAKAKTPADFAGALGLMGHHPDGALVARDGVTVMNNTDEFAVEWQVRSEESKLFSSVEGSQHPDACAMPQAVSASAKKRRLGESLLTAEEAAIACARVTVEDRDECIFDGEFAAFAIVGVACYYHTSLLTLLPPVLVLACSVGHEQQAMGWLILNAGKRTVLRRGGEKMVLTAHV